MGRARELLDELLDRADARLLPAVYRLVSISPSRVRAKLRLRGRPFVDPELRSHPPRAELARTARWVAASTRSELAALAGVAGLAGALSVPPEAAAHVAAILRLAQRLAVVYGVDPTGARGQMLVWRAVAAALELDLPEGGALELRVSDLPAAIRPKAGARTATSELAGRAVRSAVLAVGTRASRLVPVLSSGWAAAAARVRTDAAAERMIGLLEQLADAGPIDPDRVVDAVEIPRARSTGGG